MNGVKWLFFDLGSTLVDESEVYRDRCEHVIRHNGIDRDAFMIQVYESARTSMYPVKAVARRFNTVLPAWNNQLEVLYEESSAVLEALSDSYKLGIIANQQPGTRDRLNYWGIGKYFNTVIVSDETGCGKPDPRIFCTALEKAECKPDEAVMIGDRLDNDIAPAQKLGMKTVWVRQGFAAYYDPKPEDPHPDLTINKIGELIKAIKG